MLIGLAVGAGALYSVLPPIPQPQWYHDFADKRVLFGVDNFADVISNLAFLIVGALGIAHLASSRCRHGIADSATRSMYFVFFLAVALTAIGSAYYHLRPDDARLVWDRLPIAIAFMALLGVVLTENLSRRAGILLFMPLLMAGAAGVMYWHVTEQAGRGDLRPYLLSQLYAVFAVPLIVWLSPARYTGAVNLYAAIGWYAAAKVYEFLDDEIYALGQIVSGHTLKHLGAAVSCYVILNWIRKRGQADMVCAGLRVTGDMADAHSEKTN